MSTINELYDMAQLDPSAVVMVTRTHAWLIYRSGNDGDWRCNAYVRAGGTVLLQVEERLSRRRDALDWLSDAVLGQDTPS